jgi:hypothetical protein
VQSLLKKNKKIISIFCCLLIALLPSTVYANEGLVTQLEKHDAAPFKGILLTNDTAAKLFADIKFSKKECEARLKKELDFSKIKYEGLLKTEGLKLEVETSRLTGMISVRDDRIKFLEDSYTPSAWYESGEFWFAVGVIAGVGITTAAGYAIGQAK